MDPDSVAIVTSIVGALVGVAGVVIALESRRSSAKSARESAAASEAAARSAAEAADALRRSAGVAERDEAGRAPAWRVAKTGPNNWEVVNVGTATAWEVGLYLTGGTPIRGDYADSLRPNESAHFMTFVGMGSASTKLQVSWSLTRGDRSSLEYQQMPLP